MPPIFAAAHANVLALVPAAQIVAQSEEPGFPVGNLANGRSWLPFRFGVVGDRGVDFDLATTRCDFEAAFVSGLPVASGGTWGAEPGATLVRNTALPGGGAAALEVVGGATARAWLDFDLPAGHWATVEFAARAQPGGSWRVQLQDLRTREFLSVTGTGVAWSDKAGAVVARGASQAWSTFAATFEGRSSAVVGSRVSKLRLWFDGDGGAPAPLFDDIAVWPSVACGAVVGHNMPPLAGAYKLYAADDPAAFGSWGNQSEDDVAFEMPLSGATAFGPQTGDALLHKRYWRLWGPEPPADLVGHIGMFFVGQLTSRFEDYSTYPIEVRVELPQVRTGAQGAETQVALRADVPVRSVDIAITSASIASARADLQVLADATFGAARCLLVVPLNNVATAMWGRFGAGVTQSQTGLNSVAMGSITFAEEPFPRMMP